MRLVLALVAAFAFGGLAAMTPSPSHAQQGATMETGSNASGGMSRSGSSKMSGMKSKKMKMKKKAM